MENKDYLIGICLISLSVNNLSKYLDMVYKIKDYTENEDNDNKSDSEYLLDLYADFDRSINIDGLKYMLSKKEYVTSSINNILIELKELKKEFIYLAEKFNSNVKKDDNLYIYTEKDLNDLSVEKLNELKNLNATGGRFTVSIIGRLKYIEKVALEVEDFYDIMEDVDKEESAYKDFYKVANEYNLISRYKEVLKNVSKLDLLTTSKKLELLLD